MTIRRWCFRFYWKAQRLIAPALKDGQAAYEERLSELAAAKHRWLDLGCGHQVLQAWRSEAERAIVDRTAVVVGLDLEHEALKRHRTIRRRVRGDLTTLPFATGTFDLVSANMVLEHLPDPARQLREIFRVLKPGGTFLALTPNRRGYQAMMARVIPDPAKRRLVKLLQGRPSEDVFPAYYKINTEAALASVAAQTGFSATRVDHVGSAAQLILVPPLVVIELLFMRLLMTRWFWRLQPNLLAALEKR